MTSPAMEEAPETDPIADALTEHWGERCPDFHPDCHTCKAWKRYDAFVRCEPLLGEAEKALAKVDADWTETFPSGPEGSRDWAGGLGTLSDSTIETWQAIRAALSALREGRQP